MKNGASNHFAGSSTSLSARSLLFRSIFSSCERKGSACTKQRNSCAVQRQQTNLGVTACDPDHHTESIWDPVLAQGQTRGPCLCRRSRVRPIGFCAPESVATRALELNMMFVVVQLIRRMSQSMFSALCHMFEISDDQWCMTTKQNSLRTGQPRSPCDPMFPLFRSNAISAYHPVFTDAVLEQFVWRELVLNAV